MPPSLQAKSIGDGVVKREDVFVVSKLFQTHHVWKGDASRVHQAIDQTLADLQVEYLDLYLMHWYVMCKAHRSFTQPNLECLPRGAGARAHCYAARTTGVAATVTMG